MKLILICFVSLLLLRLSEIRQSISILKTLINDENITRLMWMRTIICLIILMKLLKIWKVAGIDFSKRFTLLGELKIIAQTKNSYFTTTL